MHRPTDAQLFGDGILKDEGPSLNTDSLLFELQADALQQLLPWNTPENSSPYSTRLRSEAVATQILYIGFDSVVPSSALVQFIPLGHVRARPFLQVWGFLAENRRSGCSMPELDWTFC